MQRRHASTGGTGALLLSAWILGAGVLLLRQPGIPATETVWAEDGLIFVSDAALIGPFRTIVAPYAGYLNLAPRLIAGIVSVFPLEWASMLLAVAGAVVGSGLAVYVFVASKQLFVTWWARGLLASMVVLLPAAGWESLNNVTNLQWSLILPCLMALVLPAAATGPGAVIAFLAATTSPVTLLFLPVAAFRLRRPDSGSLVPIAFLAGAALQVAVAAIDAEDPFRAPTDPLALPGLYGLRVAGTVVAGDWVLPWGWSAIGPWFGIAALAAAAGLIAFGCVATRSTAPLAAAGASFALFAFPVLIRGTSLLIPLPGHLDLGVGSKWVVAPSLVLLMGILLGIDPNLRGETPPGRRLPALVLAVALTGLSAVAVVAGFRVPNERRSGPRWSEGVAAAAQACDTGEEIAIVPVSPLGWNAGIPCRRIVADQALVATTSIWRPNSGQRNGSDR